MYLPVTVFTSTLVIHASLTTHLIHHDDLWIRSFIQSNMEQTLSLRMMLICHFSSVMYFTRIDLEQMALKYSLECLQSIYILNKET